MSLKERLMTGLENELNRKGFAEVYELVVDCHKCPVYDECHFDKERNKLSDESCKEYVNRIIEEE